MNKAKQLKLLMDCARLFADGKVCNEPDFMKWWGIVKHCHSRGYLYTGFDDHGGIDLACIAYLVKEANTDTGDNIPEKEDGDILYVLACASISDSNLKLTRLLKWYLRDHKIISIAYHKRNTNELVIHNLRGNHCGKEK